jgi:hypothetical protein
MHPVLEQTYSVLSDQLNGLDVAATQMRPVGDALTWNIQEVLEHLLATYLVCWTSLEERLAKARPLVCERFFPTRLRQWLVIDLGYFPPGRKAPEAVLPRVVSLAPQEGAGLQEAARAAISTLDEALERVYAVYPSEPVVTHMVLGPLTVRQWRKFHRVHARHHAKQMARVRAAIASP